jgi:hypothetical protein
MSAALLALIATVHAEPLPDWAIERIRESAARIGAPPVVAVAGSDAEAAAREASEALGQEVDVVRGLDPLRSLDVLLDQASVDCGYLLTRADGGTWTMHRRGLCGLEPPPESAPGAPDEAEIEALAADLDDAPAKPGIIVRFAEVRAGGNGVTWSAGPSVDFRTGHRTSVGGSALVVTNGYLGTDLRLSLCGYLRDFEKGLYGRFDLGTGSALSSNGFSLAGALALGPAWRLPFLDRGEPGYFGVVDIGFQARVEGGFGGSPFEGAIFGTNFSVSGGLGL